jgi:hypothetical protein
MTERERAIIGLTQLGISEQDIRGTLRDARTLARLAEAACNGDWPCDNGQRTVVSCDRCGCGMVRSKVKTVGACRRLRDYGMQLCEDCRVSDRVETRLRPYAPQGIGVEIQGDPRGYVVKVYGPGREVGIA